MNIDPDIPIYAYIKRELKNQIESGELPVGARVPSELELARQYEVSRNPTRQALRDLEMEGYITRTPGRGSFVAPPAQRQKLLLVSGWKAFAIACPELECHYTRNVVQNFIRHAADRGFQTMVYFMRFSNESEYEFLADIRNSGIAGLALWLQHMTPPTLDLLRRFQRSSFPLVLVDRYVPDLETDFVGTDNADVGYRLTKSLIDRGHKNIGVVTAELDNTAVDDRIGGYKRALREADLTYNEQLLGVFTSNKPAIAEVMNRIMANRARPTAFFCVNDGCAAKLVDQLGELGYRIPQDVEVATVDDNELAASLDVPIIAAAQSSGEMGRLSAELLMERVNQPARAMQRRFLKAEIQHDMPGPISFETGDPIAISSPGELVGKSAPES